LKYRPCSRRLRPALRAPTTSCCTRATPPADVLAEQARIDRADALVLVFPIYWWSLPGLLKGWIDRVFVNGWAIVTARIRRW
jgi:putative NADPH-quinone reductase